MSALFWASLALLYYAYTGYGHCLRLVLAMRRRAAPPPPAYGEAPFVTVLLTVHNEAARIESRLRNLLASDMPCERFEILVASDGSTDATESIVGGFAGNARVRLFAPGERLGKTETQNRALRVARGEVIVFTDAETSFRPETLAELVLPFADPAVGGTTGQTAFQQDDNAVSQGQGMYWSYEMRLREMESRLGILAVASGQCMAARRALLKPMEAWTGEDCIVPLDVVEQGYLVRHCPHALAYDRMESAPEREFRTRVRMTLRNWVGTLSRRSLLNPFAHPGYAFSLVSHKIIRWLSPVYVIAATVAAAVLCADPFYLAALIGACLAYAGAALGWIAARRHLTVPVVSTLFSFSLANLGFLVGLVKLVTGQRIVSYRSGVLEKQK